MHKSRYLQKRWPQAVTALRSGMSKQMGQVLGSICSTTGAVCWPVPHKMLQTQSEVDQPSSQHHVLMQGGRAKLKSQCGAVQGKQCQPVQCTVLIR